MTGSILSAPHFHDEAAAYAFVEARLWANGRDCPHCGVVDKSGPLKGKSTRIRVYKCYACRKPFTVKVGTVFEASNINLHIWLQAIHLLASSKKGFSANQFARTLGVSLKAAWFMAHRIREAMRADATIPFGKAGGAVEADETFWLMDPDSNKKAQGGHGAMKVLTLIDRDSGSARSVVIDDLNRETIEPILRENIAREARLMTDEAHRYKRIGREFAEHGSVNHGKDEYVSTADPTIHTNTVENYYSVFKRGMKGTYQHCAKRHLHRYCAEFDFRYSNRVALGVDDTTRAARILDGVKGKRLTYRPAD
jgi:transposase-like protein